VCTAGQLAIIMRMLHCIVAVAVAVAVAAAAGLLLLACCCWPAAVVAGFVSDPQSDKNCS